MRKYLLAFTFLFAAILVANSQVLNPIVQLDCEPESELRYDPGPDCEADHVNSRFIRTVCQLYQWNGFMWVHVGESTSEWQKDCDEPQTPDGSIVSEEQANNVFKTACPESVSCGDWIGTLFATRTCENSEGGTNVEHGEEMPDGTIRVIPQKTTCY